MATTQSERAGDIAIIRLDNPPVNALSHGLRVSLLEAFKGFTADPAVKAIVITGGPRAFSAGADITEFKSGRREPLLWDIIEVIEASAKPVVAAVNGLALGGGLEIALGCHYRVIGRDVRQLGLPEVKIGIIPGAGGTQRLPRVIGVPAALDMIVSGNPMDAKKAAATGLADRLVDGDVAAAAVEFARELVAAGKGARRTSEIAIDAAALPAGLFDQARAAAARHPSGPAAAKACIDAVEAAATLPFKAGMARERELILACIATPYAPALQHAFFAERKAAEIPGIGADVKLREIKSVGIIGAGTMGTGIGMAAINAGLAVTIVEMQQEPLDKGIARMAETYASLVKRGRMTAEAARARMALVTPSTDLASLKNADLVIEAVFESMAVKKDVFGKLDAICRPGAILATNTSTLDVDEIASVTKRPQDVLGLHFFSPANIMRLLEIVRGAKTAPDVLATAMAFSRRLSKVGAVSGVCFGFIGNRMLECYMEEVQAMLLEGASPQEIDGALEAWGFAMGPLAVMDLAGIDVGWRIRKEHDIGEERRRLYAVTDAIADQGRFGQKTGAGYYTYGGDRKRVADPKIAEMFKAEAARQGIARRNSIPADEIVERCLLRLVNEGARILDEGIAQRASDIDTIYLNGYGFLAWRGGPMWQADRMGAAQVAERSRAYAAKYGRRWATAPLVDTLAASGGTFAERDKAGGK